MARPHSLIVKALLAYLVLTPLAGMPAEAQSAQRSIGSPRPIDPQPTPAEITFTATAAPLTVRSLNGFRTDAATGYFSHEDHIHDGGVITVDSPWGEQLRTRYWITPHGVSFEYDDDLVVRYRFDKEGTLQEIAAESPYREATMAVGNRAQLAAQGRREFTSFDLSAYEVIEESLRSNHSDAFLAGMREAQGAIEASCGTGIILCAACIVAWANTIPAVTAACVIGGVVTFGAVCFLAILAHEAAGFACVATCVEMIRSCRFRPQGQVIPDGCEPRV